MVIFFILFFFSLFLFFVSKSTHYNHHVTIHRYRFRLGRSESFFLMSLSTISGVTV